MRRNFLIGAMIMAMTVAAVSTVRAADADWSTVLDLAQKEGEVIVWGQSGDQRAKFWKDSFEAAYPGIKVRLFQPATSSERDTRFLREMGAGVAKVDVLVSGSAGMNGRLRPAGMLQPLRPLLRSDILEGSNWVDGEPLWADPEKTYVIVSDQSAGTFAIAKGTAPQNFLASWDDLLDPRLDGKIIATDPRQSGLNFAQSLFIYHNPLLGPDYISRLYRQGRVSFATDERQMVEWVDSGRMTIALAIREPEIAAYESVGGKLQAFGVLTAQGKPQGMLMGADGAVGIPNLPTLPHPNATRVYVNWLFSREGQQAMVNATGLVSIHAKADLSSLNKRVLRVPGVQYTSANSDRLNSAEGAKAMRDVVTKTLQK